MRKVYSDFTNRFSILEKIKMACSLIEDLPAEGYDFIMTSRFQSDPLERRFGQYRQISGGRFLVGLREATSSEKIIKLKTLLKDDIDISNIMDSNVEHDENIETLLHHVDLSRCSEEIVTLSEESREVAIYIAGYIAKNWKNALVTAAIDYWSLTVELATLIFCLFKFYQEEVLQSH